MKSCKKCGETKPLSEFYKELNGKFGVRAECKICSKALKDAKIGKGKTPDGRMRLPDVSRLTELFIYDPLSGDLIRKVQSGKSRAGEKCRSPNSEGYYRAWIDGRLFMAHRIVWKMITGEEPKIIDHINGVVTDNRRGNLRAVNDAQSARNTKGTLKPIGVYWHAPKSGNRKHCWQSIISVNGRQISLGLYDDLADAIKAYNEGAMKHHGEYAARKIRHNELILSNMQ
ncbi:HNH endonuclease [Klebsiella pneumoniae]|uniref:HNH endonuclease n=1 Tax=Klebsiella pneumoniae TaxID=573 RepID=UPI000B4BB36F|nr:HNH endonuclease [Klebsiella pneumoniae]ASC26541.1 hypothetical protein AM399_00900 [Klebsiella pneumoniae]ASC41249.1 hypothetical protein AM392_20110 [Klebsiella pneumoniae]OYJ34624.1 hypothetical protein CI739_10485 [Klebsiella pneumoniae subsp. pneumoniae]HBR6295484.1 HNH endonuclease [Klebsiella pneumoniae]HBV8157734.1 HNH endonuclease [Klebsiella pneumoniae]